MMLSLKIFKFVKKMIPIITQCYQNEHLSVSDYELISQKHHLVTFEKGAFILEHSQSLNAYYILLDGCVHSFANNSNGNSTTIYLFTPHEVVIDVNALFQRKQTVENWQCLTKCTLLQISFEDFQELYHSLYGFREWGRTWMANELFQLKERSIAMRTHSAKERYEELLKNKPYIFSLVPLKLIASYLGITDTSLSRIRKELK